MKWLRSNQHFLRALGWLMALGTVVFVSSAGVATSNSGTFWSVVANLTNGLIGAFFGAGVAIWWAWRSAQNAENRAREAVATGLYAEIDVNVDALRTLQQKPNDDSEISTLVHDSFVAHMALFSGTVVRDVLECRAELHSLERFRQRLRSISAEVRAGASEEGLAGMANRLGQMELYGRLCADVKGRARRADNYCMLLQKRLLESGSNLVVARVPSDTLGPGITG